MSTEDMLTRLLSGPHGTLDTFAVACGVRGGVEVEWDVVYQGHKILFPTLDKGLVMVRCFGRPIWVSPMPVHIILIETKKKGPGRWLEVGPFPPTVEVYKRFKTAFQEVTSLDPYLFQ